jgi:flagellar biosynthesis chaperone FliJ
MKQFKFRLQRVLEYRDRICDECRQELGRLTSERDQAVQRLEDLRHQANSLTLMGGGTDPATPSGASVGGTPFPVMSVNDVILVGDYGVRLKAEIEKQEEVVREATEAVDKAREVYIEASKEVKALDSLRQKRKVDYDEAKLKDDEKNLDELTVQRFKRT